MLRVRDIMTRHVVALDADGSVDQAMWSFSANDISGAPVIDANGKICGVLSKSNLVDPVYHGTLDKGSPVRDAMTPAAWAVHPDAPAIEAVRLMVRKEIHRVLVSSEPGHLEGIVSSMDIMRALLDDGDLGDPAASPRDGSDQVLVERRAARRDREA